jgi:hypothetical protein
MVCVSATCNGGRYKACSAQPELSYESKNPHELGPYKPWTAAAIALILAQMLAQWQSMRPPRRAHPFLLLRPFNVLDPFFLLIIDTTNTSSILSLPPQTTRRTTPYITRAIAPDPIIFPLAYLAAVAAGWSHWPCWSTQQRQSPHSPPTHPNPLSSTSGASTALRPSCDRDTW